MRNLVPTLLIALAVLSMSGSPLLAQDEMNRFFDSFVPQMEPYQPKGESKAAEQGESSAKSTQNSMAEPDASEVVAEIHFREAPNGNAYKWLKEHEFTFQNNAKKLNPRFLNGRLMLEMETGWLGMLVKRTQIQGATKMRIVWGMSELPPSADWQGELKREGLGVAVTFGKELHDSGTYFLPKLPPFFVVFFGQKEKADQTYLGKYYQETGRYYCGTCGLAQADGQEVVTLFDLAANYEKEFGKGPMPEITSVSFEFDTREVEGAKGFIKKVQFLR